MRTPAISLLLLTIHAVYGQLNYEGNPLTEDTVYTAEESHFAEKTAQARALKSPEIEDSYLLAIKTLKAERSQNLYPSNDNGEKYGARSPLSNDVSSTGSSASSYNTLPVQVLKNDPAPANDAVSKIQPTKPEYYKETETKDQVYPVQNAEPLTPQVSHPSDSALAMFLNSRTPQESRMALEEYLGAGEKAAQVRDQTASPYQPHISEIVLPQRQSIGVNQQPNQIGQQDPPYLQYMNPEYPSPQLMQYFVANQQAGRNVNIFGRKAPLQSIRGPPSAFGRRSFAVRPSYKAAIYRAQPRISPYPGYRYKMPYGPGGDGLEVIYTKPPGYGKSQYFRGENPHTDAAAWFPDADHPPPDLNVYYSQLYAQSYDPHYYNYIAKYGKIKPHLYGKFDKKDEGLLSELFRSFKKHGLKHVMNPMFLLGLGIPMITLMLSALVNNGRSFARSSSGVDDDMRITDEDIDEWTTKLRRALDCYTEATSESERSKCAVWD